MSCGKVRGWKIVVLVALVLLTWACILAGVWALGMLAGYP